MKVLLVNTSERIGGAAISCRRLMEALRENGVKVKMLVRDKQTDEIAVESLPHSWKLLWTFLWERIRIWMANGFRRQNLFKVDIANTGNDITQFPEFQQADIIHLHWINQGMLSLNGIQKILKTGKPIVWTMHDMWPCTGICHHARNCEGYLKDCGNCQYLLRPSEHDLSYSVYQKKKKILSGHHINYVACSKWMEQQACKSSLLQGQHIVSIPNPINTNIYHPCNKQEARHRCSLPQDMKLILFGSVKITDKRKGVDYFIDSCKLLAKEYPELRNQVGIVVLGNRSDYLTNQLPFKVFPQEFIMNDNKIADIYNSVTLYATPSLEENLPNTIMEAMACGVPCVGFNVGGIPEMIDHLHNGYVAEYKSTEDFTNGIYWILNDPDYHRLSSEANRKVQTYYTSQVIAQKYIKVYNKLLGSYE
ncbi:MAG: glycosyltransferase family 4 protein [Bacteroidaceae bacterium]|nr:glycosyltransferase family 4 protein [Bacteroidaceae bacterium]